MLKQSLGPPILHVTMPAFRYNLIVSNSLRWSVFEPICEGCWLKTPIPQVQQQKPAGSAAAEQQVHAEPQRASELRRAAALTAAFAVSGIMHE